MRIVLAGLASGILLLSAAACGGGKLDNSLKNVRAGDCVADPGNVSTVQSLKEVKCDDPDAVHVTGVFEMTGFAEFPGEAAVDAAASERCDASSTGYIGPTKKSWDGAADRTVICYGD